MSNAKCKLQIERATRAGFILQFALTTFHFAFAFCIALSTTASAAEREKGLFEFRDGDRVVLLGSTFIERMQNDGYFETMVTAAYPHRNITFRNLGWSGDTVWGDSRAVFGTRADGFKRLVADVNLCKPTVIIVCYGENEAYAGIDGLDDFRAGLNTLLDSLESTGARNVLLGPRQRENLGPPLPDPTKYNADLRKYNATTAEVAKERGHTFVDLYSVCTEENITENGIHLADHGAMAFSIELAKLLGINSLESRITADVATGAYDARFVSIHDLTISGRRLSITSTAHSPLGDHVLLEVRDWGPGEFDVLIGDNLLGRMRSEKPAAFFPLPGTDGFKIGRKNLRATINEKNQLFFHRYRPQNETYLFLFRKHEQGNNAVEIPQFDPLIAEKEAKITELRKPLKQKFEIIKVK